MKYVLIWVLATSTGTGTSSQEFETEAACERAAAILGDYNRVDRAFCVPKGEPSAAECAADLEVGPLPRVPGLAEQRVAQVHRLERGSRVLIDFTEPLQ